MTEKARPKTSSGTSLREFRKGRDENNMAEFPMALLTDAAPAGQKTIEFEDTLKDWKTGELITRRVCITGSDKFGLPTAKDEDVLLALVQLTQIANNFTDSEVHFTKHQVIELLGWKNRGWAYDRVEESLHRWKGVSVHYWNAWRDNAKGTWRNSEAIGVIEYFSLTDGRRKGNGTNGRDSLSRFIWNRILFESFQAGYLKPLDFEVYRRLERPAARRAYRFLDKRFWHQGEWEFDLHTFACEKLGLSRAYDTGQLKERLRPALGELENIGFIEPVRYRKEKPKKWKIAIAKKRVQEKAKEETTSVDDQSLRAELMRREINAEIAKELVESFPVDCIREKLSLFDWLVSRKDKRISKNAPGWLATAIRKNYALPHDYRRAMGGSRESAATPRRLPPKRNSLEAPVPESQVKDPVQQATDMYIASLTKEELLKLEASALERADAVLADGYYRSKAAGGQAHTAYRRMLVEREAKRILDGQPQGLSKAN